MYICLHVKYPLLLSYINQLEISRYIFEKYPNSKLNENPSTGNKVVPCGRADGRTDGRKDRREDMTKPTVAFRNFANASKNGPQRKIARTFTTLCVNLRITVFGKQKRNRVKGVVNCFKPLSQNSPETLKKTTRFGISGIQVTCRNTQQFGVEKTY